MMDIGMENVEQSRKVLQQYKRTGRDAPGYDYEHYVKLPGHSDELRAPYGYLAEDGAITHNGVTFFCDTQNNRLCLGDVSDKTKCLSIELAGGGYLVVNRDNVGQLADAIDMFSPEDIARILAAVMKDKKVQELRGELEDEKSIMIGGRSYTQEEWNEMLDKYDEEAERLREAAESLGAEDEDAPDHSDLHIAYRKLRSQRGQLL